MKKKLSSLRTHVVYLIVIALMFTGVTVYAANVNKNLHPNLAAAQVFIEKAIEKVTAAQKANEFDLNGHAVKAKALLDQAYDEIKLAAKASNANK